MFDLSEIIYCSNKMGNCCKSINANDLFAYTTPKLVRIHDKRLGILNYVLMFGILSYVVIYNIAYSNQAFAYETPIGAVRFTLQEPTKDACDPTDFDNQCELDLTPKSELSYCTENHHVSRAFQKYNCTYLSSEDALHVYDQSVMISTRFKSAIWRSVCDKDEDSCTRLWNTTKGSNDTYFVADVESYTLQIDHSAQAPTLDVKGQGNEIVGRLKSTNATQCRTRADASSDLAGNDHTNSAPCYIPPQHPPTGQLFDIFQVSTILDAAELSLDSESYGNHSVRYRGSTILVAINYRNTWPWSQYSSNVTYSYDLTVLKNSEFSIEEKTPHEGGAVGDFEWRRYHGIRLVFLMSGEFGEFQFSQFMLCMATSTWMITVAAMITEFVMTHCLRLKNLYTGVKYQETKDFDRILKKEKKGFEAFVTPLGKLKFRKVSNVSAGDDDVDHHHHKQQKQQSSNALDKPLLDDGNVESKI